MAVHRDSMKAVAVRTVYTLFREEDRMERVTDVQDAKIAPSDQVE